jgi:hypothetical protein
MGYENDVASIALEVRPTGGLRTLTAYAVAEHFWCAATPNRLAHCDRLSVRVEGQVRLWFVALHLPQRIGYATRNNAALRERRLVNSPLPTSVSGFFRDSVMPNQPQS